MANTRARWGRMKQPLRIDFRVHAEVAGQGFAAKPIADCRSLVPFLFPVVELPTGRPQFCGVGSQLMLTVFRPTVRRSAS